MMKKIVLTLLILISFTQMNVFAKTKKGFCKPVYTVQQGVYEGFQIVKCDKLYGIKNSFSHVMVNPKYNKMENIDDRFVKVKMGKDYGLIDYNGKVLAQPKYKDVQFAEFKLTDDKPFYLYLGKTKKNWFIINNLQETVITKTPEKTAILETDLNLLPHKIQINKIKYHILLGTMKVGEILTGTPVRILIPMKLPTWTLNQISTLGLMSIFEPDKNSVR